MPSTDMLFPALGILTLYQTGHVVEVEEDGLMLYGWRNAARYQRKEVGSDLHFTRLSVPYALTFTCDWRLTAFKINILSCAVSILQLFTLIFI
ncbi:hypothetical protein [Sutcliffiella sp. FSL R7-0096]|uniref:hypothetical protein n=1 Tax=Sutcliffiella sp. FSL R7-0096 TaxID=2921670 RepID=UPI00315AA969